MPAIAIVIVVAIIAILAILAALPSKPPVCHRAPDGPYTPDEAHQILQYLINCDTETCAAKRGAYWALADAGLITADLRVAR